MTFMDHRYELYRRGLTTSHFIQVVIVRFRGPVAQRITRLTTNQEIAGSNPARLDIILFDCNSCLSL